MIKMQSLILGLKEKLLFSYNKLAGNKVRITWHDVYLGLVMHNTCEIYK